jgi:hypothetical protein
MKNLEDFYEVIEYIWENYLVLLHEQNFVYKYYIKECQEYKKIYTLYRNIIFLEREIGKQLFFWNQEDDFKLMAFYNNVYIRISYYKNKNCEKYKFIYPGKEFDRILAIEKEKSGIKVIEGKIYYITDPAHTKELEKQKKEETNLIIYNPIYVITETDIEDLLTLEYYESSTEEEYDEDVSIWKQLLEESKEFISDYVENVRIERGIGIELDTEKKEKQEIKEYIEWIEKNYDKELYNEYQNPNNNKIYIYIKKSL